MLHIVLLILKIIGILILVILGIALCLLLAGLLVPVRYGIRGSYYGALKGSIKITWLLHIVSAVISYDGATFMQVSILGIPVYRPDKKKAGKELLDSLEPEIPEAKKAADSAARTVKRAGETLSGKDTGSKTGETLQEKDTGSKTGETLPGKDTGGKAGETLQEKDTGSITGETFSGKDAGSVTGMTASEKKYRKHPWNLFKELPERIKGFFKKIRRLIRRIKGKFRQADTALQELKAWIDDEDNKKMIRDVWRHARALIRHGLPRKVKGRVVFGFDDPYVTGQVLSWAGMLYPLYGRKISVQPVFDRVILECEGTIKGRIRVGTVCIRLLGAYRNKKFKALIKKWMG